MRQVVLVLTLPLLLSACGWWKQPTPERQALKEQCVGQDYQACSDIGHMARKDMSTAANGTQPTAPTSVSAPVATTPFVTSGEVTGAEPIID